MLLLPIPLIFYLQALKTSDLGNEALAAQPSLCADWRQPVCGVYLIYIESLPAGHWPVYPAVHRHQFIRLF